MQEEWDDIADETIDDIMWMIDMLPAGVNKAELLMNVLTTYASSEYDSLDDAVMGLSGITLNSMLLLTGLDQDGACRWNKPKQ